MTAHTRTDKRKHLFILSMSDYQCLFLAHNLCYFIMLVWKWYQTWTWFISFLLLLILIKVVSCLKKYMLRKHQCHILTALHDTFQQTYQWLHKKHGIFYLLDFPALDCHLWINHCALWEWLNFTSRVSISVILLQWEACIKTSPFGMNDRKSIIFSEPMKMNFTHWLQAPELGRARYEKLEKKVKKIHIKEEKIHISAVGK